MYGTDAEYVMLFGIWCCIEGVANGFYAPKFYLHMGYGNWYPVNGDSVLNCRFR